MDNIFNDYYSLWVQRISIIVEMFGLTLVIIELRYPSIKIEIEKFLIQAPTEFQEWQMNKFYSYVRLIFFSIFSIIFIQFLTTSFNPEYITETLQVMVAFGALACFITMIIISTINALISVVSRFFGILKKISPIHPIGALGLFFGALGFIGEFYQIMTQEFF